MLLKIVINFIFIYTCLFNKNVVLTQTLVADNLIDLCYNDNPMLDFVNHSSCELSQILKFDKHQYRNDNFFYCIVIDNRNGLCDELIIDFDGFNNTRRMEYQNALQKARQNDSSGNREYIQLLNTMQSIVISSNDQHNPLQAVASVHLNKNEFKFNSDVIHVNNLKNLNSQRYAEKCQEICDLNVCSTTKYGACIEHLKFSDNDDFWCVVLYKKNNENNNNTLLEVVEIEFLAKNHRIRWVPSDIKVIEQNQTHYKWEIKTDKIVIAIERENHNENLSELKTVKLDGILWYDYQSSNKSIQPKCNNEVLDHTPLTSSGENAFPGEFPWHVAIYEVVDLNQKYLGSGSIISSTMILTVAHIFPETSSEIIVSAGKTNLLLSDANSKDFIVLETIIHEAYWDMLTINNIALLRLKTEIQFTDYIKPIHLSNDPIIFESRKCNVVGWERNDLFEIQTELKNVELLIINDPICKASDWFYKSFLSNGMFCAGFEDGTSTCASGGSGLVIKHDGLYYLKGFASHGKATDDCGVSLFTIYTDVPYYYDWINSKL